MLSATYSVSDVKAKLRRGFAFYSFADDDAFTDAITEALSEVRFEIVYPRIGSDYYASVAALDKTGLSETQEQLYWAEVYFAAGRFLAGAHYYDTQELTGGSESVSIDGFSRSVTASTGSTQYGKQALSSHFRDRAETMMIYAGYARTLQRGDGGIYAGSV